MPYNLFDNQRDDWTGKFGVKFSTVCETILGLPSANNWLDAADADAQIDASELYNFTINFYRYTEQDPHVAFDLIFNYENDVRAARLRDVVIEPDFQGHGLGGHILTRSLDAALLLGCDRLFVEPDSMGSYYWPRHGAIISGWPRHYLAERFEPLFENPMFYLPEWKEQDIQRLMRVLENRDPQSLNELAARDDLYVFDDQRKKVRIGKYLLEDIGLETCIFDLQNSWTLERLRAKLGYDVEAKRTKPPQRPPLIADSASHPDLRF